MNAVKDGVYQYVPIRYLSGFRRNRFCGPVMEVLPSIDMDSKRSRIKPLPTIQLNSKMFIVARKICKDRIASYY